MGRVSSLCSKDVNSLIAFREGFCFFFFSRNFVYLFYFWLSWVLLLLRLQCGERGLLWLEWEAFSLQWLLVTEHRLQGRRASAVEPPGLQSTGSVVVAYQLQSLCSLWDRPRWEMESMYPSLACRFFTTEPPGKPQGRVFNVSVREGAAGQVISSCTIFSLVGVQVKF